MGAARKVPSLLGERSRMTRHEEREHVIVLLNESVKAAARQAKACEILGLSERTLRQYQPSHKLTALKLTIANKGLMSHQSQPSIVSYETKKF